MLKLKPRVLRLSRMQTARLMVLGLLVLLVGCDTPATLVMESDGTGNLSVPLPSSLRDSRSIDPNQLRLTADLDGVSETLEPNSGRTQWSGQLRLMPKKEATLTLTWSHGRFAISTMSKTIGPLTSNTTLELSSEKFDSQNFDEDADGYTNLMEIREDLAVDNSAIPGAPNLDVIVPWISESDAPTIDGSYDDIWSKSKFVDVRRDTLKIDNLMLGDPGTRADAATEFQWSTFHDDTYLYIFIYGEDVTTSALYGDSVDARDDDAINIFIDGDNSKDSVYDGINDFHIIIPMLKLNDEETLGNRSHTSIPDGEFAPEDLIDSQARIQPGPNSAPLPTGIVYVNCVCRQGQHSWEIRLNMGQLGIQRQKTFGIEVQLDDDFNGGGRDTRWAWKHRSRTATDVNGVNGTANDPRLMGVAYRR